MHIQIIKPYISQTNVHKKAESLRVASLSKLVNSHQSSIQRGLNSPQNGRPTCT